MATFKFKGVNELIAQYEKLDRDADKMIGKAIYNGAAVVMDSVKSSVDGITTDDRFGTPDNPTAGPSTIQKIGLQHALGIAKLRNDNGFRNVKIGFDGYNSVHTKTWPNGQPNMMVARSIESGTSWMQKQPFMRRAEQAARSGCEQAMSDTIDKEIKRIVNG